MFWGSSSQTQRFWRLSLVVLKLTLFWMFSAQRTSLRVKALGQTRDKSAPRHFDHLMMVFHKHFVHARSWVKVDVPSLDRYIPTKDPFKMFWQPCKTFNLYLQVRILFLRYAAKIRSMSTRLIGFLSLRAKGINSFWRVLKALVSLCWFRSSSHCLKTPGGF